MKNAKANKTYGYSGNDNSLISESDRETLKNGGQITANGNVYFSFQHSPKAKCIYSVDPTKNLEITAGRSASYIGFLIGSDFYHVKNTDLIAEKFKEDVNEELRRLIPGEETAEINAGALEEWDLRNANEAKTRNCKKLAQRLFYDSKKPELCLCGEVKTTHNDLIRYILEPESSVVWYAAAIASKNKIGIYVNWIIYNKITQEYKAIINDPQREEHQLKAIFEAITDEKTVKLDLTNESTVRVDAKAVKYLCYRGIISSWDVAAQDRQCVPKRQPNQVEGIRLADIKAILHGHKILYRVA